MVSNYIKKAVINKLDLKYWAENPAYNELNFHDYCTCLLVFIYSNGYSTKALADPPIKPPNKYFNLIELKMTRYCNPYV